MPDRLIPLFVFFCLITVAAQVSAAVKKPARPNILYFYVDDMGWGSIGPNGQAERKAKGLAYVRTPNLDKLAAQGLNFTRGYGCHVCSPARASQQTGFHQGHTYADRNDPDNARKAMRADDILMGDALLKAGYMTGYWGKWGFGGSKDKINPKIDNVQTLPTSHGYKHVVAELHHVRAHTFFQPTLWRAPAKPGAIGGLELAPNSMKPYQNNKAYPNEPAFQNDPNYPATAYCDDVYAFAALDFVRAQGVNYNKTGQPFFGLFAAQIPHAPFGEISRLPEWDKVYRDEPKFSGLARQTKQWAAMVTRIDAHFGNILAALEDPNNDGDTSDSIVDNTLVIFQSDNGGPGGSNNSELDANGGLSGNKGQIQEGGIRVPLVMRWPARINGTSKIKAGSNVDKVVDVTDLLPTFCELAGTEIPLGLDGVSIAPMLTGEGHQREREFIIHEAGNGSSIIYGDYKLVRKNKQSKQSKTKKGKKSKKKANVAEVSSAVKAEPSYVLYDLSKDHGEKKDIAGDYPELVTKLKTLLLGERVEEPKGFANTYHYWQGSAGSKVTKADSWSDYVYANNGIEYMTDKGPPRLSWVATLVNSTQQKNVAVVDGDVSFLALQVGGGSEASQMLKVGQHQVVGRNEIRILQGGLVEVTGGKLSSLRWIDLTSGGSLGGYGYLKGDVFNRGQLSISQGHMHVSGDIRQTQEGQMRFLLDDKSQLDVDGAVHLNGKLTIQMNKGRKVVSRAAFTIIKAKRVNGRFEAVEFKGSAAVDIVYKDNEVAVIFK